MSYNELKKEKSSFINQFKDTKYQELQTIQKEVRNLESQINAIKFQNQKQSIVSPTDGKKITIEGEQRYLETGMSVTAEIKVGKEG